MAGRNKIFITQKRQNISINRAYINRKRTKFPIEKWPKQEQGIGLNNTNDQ